MTEGLNKFVISHQENEETYPWSRPNTLLLLELYKVYRRELGKMKLNLRNIFQIIAEQLSRQLQEYVSPADCENRWTVLERGYEKYIDNSTGRGRIEFEYSKEMEDILGHKKSIVPELLLSSDTVDRVKLKIRRNRTTRPVIFDVLREMMRAERKDFNKKKFEIEERKL